MVELGYLSNVGVHFKSSIIDGREEFFSRPFLGSFFIRQQQNP